MDQDTNVADDLAINLQALRKQWNLSQHQLSKMADIPRSTITNIESGQGNPSLSNLSKLSTALSISIAELLSKPRDDTKLLKACEIPVVKRSGHKAHVYKLMPDQLTGIEIDRIELAPNASMGGHPHLQGTKEYFSTVKGEFVINLKGIAHTVKEGDVLAFPGAQPHSYKNTQAQKSVGISVVLPAPYLLE
jgi:XRE family transcriptional regulator, regulator of sulfur utilization